MEPLVRFGVLGPLQVQGPHGPIDVSPGKQRAILALLLLDANEVISRDRLVGELWGETPPPNAVKALLQYTAQVREDEHFLEQGAGMLNARGAIRMAWQNVGAWRVARS